MLVIDPENACDLWQVGEKLQNPIVTKQDKDSPLMVHVRLDNVLMPEARKLTFPARAAGAGLGAGQAIRCTRRSRRPDGKVLVLTVNLDQGDLPLRTAFPILVTNALAWFAGNRASCARRWPAGPCRKRNCPSKHAPSARPELLLWTPRRPAAGRCRRIRRS